MGNVPLKRRLYDSVSILFMIFILFYGIQAIVSFFWDISPPFIDFFIIILALAVMFALHLKFRFKKIVPVCIFIGALFHIVGLYQIFPYGYDGTLYGAPQMGYHYDWIVHSAGFAFYVIAFSSIMYPYLKKAFKSKFILFFLILFPMIGLSAVHEIVEFAGYTVFGYGEGFLEFGAGDISPDAGPWRNACMDLVSNLVGGVIAAGIFILAKSYKKKHK